MLIEKLEKLEIFLFKNTFVYTSKSIKVVLHVP